MMTKLTLPLALSAMLGLFLAQSASASDGGPLATVTGGQIRGTALPADSGSVFRGVPFAQPPVGDLRWREPMPVIPWTGIRDADKPGAPAAQSDAGWNKDFAAAGSEDCLYLDVWAPPPSPKAPHPVMVWIHGGGNVAGAGGFDFLYDGKAFAKRGVILVVIEYRLGPFGFFTHPDLAKESPHHSSGNYGIMDQVAALQWVHDNIATFGGDPENVTIFGQSAGATDVLALMATPISQGLFKKVISESSALPGPLHWGTVATAEDAGRAAAASVGAPPGSLALLRSLSAETLLKNLPGHWQPAPDNYVFPVNPAVIFSQGKEADVPLIIGSCAIEFPVDGDFDIRAKIVQMTFGKHAPEALELYGMSANGDKFPADPLYGNSSDQLGSDIFRGPAIVEGAWHAAHGSPTWQYQFERAIPPRPRVGHSSDIPYVFGNLLPYEGQGGAFTDVDRKLSDDVQGYWVNFAKTGNPNGAAVPSWPAFDASGRKFVHFTAEGGEAVDRDERAPFATLYSKTITDP
ncbi:MAG TPA: carboxylesterase family protein [Opitutaceae bacterium]|nr:carboxylesterase family protein [Opitutaceae bacterium]